MPLIADGFAGVCAITDSLKMSSLKVSMNYTCNGHTVDDGPTVRDDERFFTLVGPRTLREINLRVKAENSDLPICIAGNFNEYVKKIFRIHEKESPSSRRNASS